MTAPAAAPAPGQDVDSLLVRRTLEGDRNAFGLLVSKYQRRIQRLIGRMVRDPDLVEDIAQETFVQAFRALAGFRGESQFFTWLYRIAVNCAKKARAQGWRDPLVFGGSSAGEAGEDETYRPINDLSTGETPEMLLAAKEVAALVSQVLGQLSDELRQAITLREIEGLSYEEIAGMMNCPIGTVRSRIFRARELISGQLRPLLQRQGGKRW